MRRTNHPIPLYKEKSNIPFLLRHCAEQLLQQAALTDCNRLLEDLVCHSDYTVFCKEHPEIHKLTYRYVPTEDTLGLLYQSLCDIDSRKNSGSYYTPGFVAEKLITRHLQGLSSVQTVLDPACGTGIFLLQLPDTVPLKNLYGNDCNPVSITITRINLALKYHISSADELDLLYRNFTVSDYLSSKPGFGNGTPSFCHDIILGNPPWGATLTEEQKKEYLETFACVTKNSIEIFDLFIEQALKQLAPGGLLSFILPESIFHVTMHAPVRKLLLTETTAVSVEYLGDIFKQVYCPSTILTVRKECSGHFYKDTLIYKKSGSYRIHSDRNLTENGFSFSLSDAEYTLLQKILNAPNCTALQGQADFALGIVTGNNAALLSDIRLPGMEPIIKGKDISKYHIDSVSGYLRFAPEQFQQTAPEHYYRAPEKLFYRFINKQLIFAYDNTGILSLNSCNIVIPHITGHSVKYVMAILNSSIAQFVFEKRFSSIKVLRSHLEAIPIPVADEETQTRIVSMVETLMEAKRDSELYDKTYFLLDQFIAGLFGLSDKEYQILTL